MTTSHTANNRASAEQLPLLAVPDIPLQFRLDERTRRVGLANVASIKAQLHDQEARRLARMTPHTHHRQAA
jgi:hypothetical protein